MMPQILEFLGKNGIIYDAIRGLLAAIDWVIYNLFSILMQTIFDIASFPLNNMTVVEDILQRVYLIVAIFMVFKITISLLGYLVNPDQITDKSQGAGKLVSRVIISLIMLIMLPFVFNLMIGSEEEGGLQGPILRTIPRLILGTETGYDQTDGNDMTDIGKNISWSVLKSFFYYSEDCEGKDGNLEVTKIESTKQYDSELNAFVGEINAECDSDHSVYKYGYQAIISTLAGAFSVYILLGIAISIAIRMFKLILLRMIAPIPIISYIDPKQAKDGTFNKWAKMLIKTWLDLFINIAILYLVIMLVDELISGGFGFDAYTGSWGFFRKSFFMVFILLGLFMFAKQAPKFICESLGIKSDDMGDFGKILGSLPVAAGIGLGAAGAVASHAAASYSADTALGKAHNPGRILKNIGAGLLGGAGSAISGVQAGANAKNNKLGATLGAMQKKNAADLQFGRNGGTFLGSLGSAAAGFFGAPTEYESLEQSWKNEEDAIKAEELDIKSLQDQNSHRKAIMDRVGSKASEADWTSGSYNGITGNYRKYNSAMTSAINSGDGVYEDYSSKRKYFEFEGQRVYLDEAQSIGMGLLEANKDDWYAAAISHKNANGTFHDDVVDSEVGLLSDAGGSIPSSLGNMKADSGKTGTTISTRSDALNRRRSALNAAKTSKQAAAAKANATRYGGKKQ